MGSIKGRSSRTWPVAPVAALAGVCLMASAAASAPVLPSAPESAGPVYTVHQIFSGTTLTHWFTPAGTTTPDSEALTHPDDITQLGDHLFVGFQNGVGPQGEPSSDGNTDSTIVELKMNGDPVHQWDVLGKADGVTADPQTGVVIVTVNEDANSSLYTIDPGTVASADQVVHYAYDEPLAHMGGTDAISIYGGQLLISASAPGTTGASAPQPNYPAVYSVQLNPTTMVATVTPLFYDESTATTANAGADYGSPVTLGLTDPDSNEIVPFGARFGGDFMLTSQGDLEQIYVADAGGRHQRLSVLTLSQSVDDTAWPTRSSGALYATDSTNDSVDSVRGPFVPGWPMVVATPCGSNSAPGTCPAPPMFPANYLATLNPTTGQVSPVVVEGAAFTPQGGLLFAPRRPGGGTSE